MVGLIENIKERFNLGSAREDSAQLLRLIEKRNPDVAKITQLIENGRIDIDKGTGKGASSRPPPLITALLEASRVRSGEAPSGQHIAIANALIDAGANVTNQSLFMTAYGIDFA